jgi:hypothetical protein
MDITHARSTRHTEYFIGGQKLDYVETERLLGVHLSKDLKWNHHTEVVRKKGAQILAQPEGLHAQGQKDGLSDARQADSILRHPRLMASRDQN